MNNYTIHNTYTSRNDGRSICTDCVNYQKYYGCILQLNKGSTALPLSCNYYNYGKKNDVYKN